MIIPRIQKKRKKINTFLKAYLGIHKSCGFKTKE